jgi:hypothetical protein
MAGDKYADATSNADEAAAVPGIMLRPYGVPPLAAGPTRHVSTYASLRHACAVVGGG